MNDEVGRVSPLTMYRASFVGAFGYKCYLYRKADNYLDDEMRIVLGKDDSRIVRRERLPEWIKARHNVSFSKNKPKFYVIEHPNWFESLEYI